MQDPIVTDACRPQLESARLFIPGWLQRAFELSLSCDIDLRAQALQSGLLRPGFDGGELAFLSLLMGELQRQIFYGDPKSQSFKISLDMASGHLSRLDLNHRNKMIHVFEALGQLRFLLGDEEVGFQASRLFIEENWLLETASPHPVALTLNHEEYADEVITGYMDAHADFLRKLLGRRELRKLNCDLKPLVIWTPVWLELSQAEQLVYLRMEKAMQTHGSWLRLDGLIGAPLDALVSGLRSGKRGGVGPAGPAGPVGERTSRLLENLKLFGRLGRRLAAHGVIRKQPENGYMATDRNMASSSPFLLWQASAERLRSKAEIEYMEIVGHSLLMRMPQDRFEALMATFSGLSGDWAGNIGRFRSIWDAIKAERGLTLTLTSGVLLHVHLLFLEWVARSSANTLVPLPEWHMGSTVARLLRDLSAANALERFRDFCKILEENRQELGALSNPLSNLPLTVASDEIKRSNWLSQLAQFAQSAAKNGGNPKDSKLFSSSKLSSSDSVETRSVVDGPHITPEKAGQTGAEGAQKLHRLAYQELEKMIQGSPADYSALKRKYFSSLDSETRAMVLNVERRLDSRDFDRQLRARLVRFMVDHPASWTSSNSTLSL